MLKCLSNVCKLECEAEVLLTLKSGAVDFVACLLTLHPASHEV